MEKKKYVSKKIIHISDLHISNDNDKDDEYNDVFNKLFISLKKNKINRKSSLIVITGDILNNYNLNGSSINILINFLNNLSEITNILLIEGNHDIDEKDYNRKNYKSFLSVLINILNNDRVKILNKEENYMYEDIVFLHTYVFDKKIINFEKEDGKKYIRLYHGMVKERNENANFTVNELEKDMDLVLLGDYHEKEIFSEKTYSVGSLIQQKYGESFNKGYYIHTIKRNKIEHKFVEVKNNYGYIKIYDNKIDEINFETIPKKLKIMFINHEGSNFNETMLREKLLENKKEIIELKTIIKHDLKNMINSKIYETIKNKYIEEDLTKEMKYIEIKTLRASNFLNYSRVILNFKNGENFFTGQKSYGKTNLYRIIYFSIFGNLIEDIYDRKRIIKISEDYYRTEINLLVNNNNIIIKRIGESGLIKDLKEEITIYLNGRIIKTKEKEINWIRKNIINEKDFIENTLIDGNNKLLEKENNNIKKYIFNISGAKHYDNIKKILNNKIIELSKEKLIKNDKEILKLKKSIQYIDSHEIEQKIEQKFLKKIENNINLVIDLMKNIDKVTLYYKRKKIYILSNGIDINILDSISKSIYEILIRLILIDMSEIKINLLFIDNYNNIDEHLKNLNDVFNKYNTKSILMMTNSNNNDKLLKRKMRQEFFYENI